MNIQLLILFIILACIIILFSSIIYTKSYDGNKLNTTYLKIFIIILITITVVTLILKYYYKTNYLGNKEIVLVKGCIKDSSSYKINSKNINQNFENNGIEFTYAFRLSLANNIQDLPERKSWIHIWHKGYIDISPLQQEETDTVLLPKTCNKAELNECNRNPFCNWTEEDTTCNFNKDIPPFIKNSEKKPLSIIQSPSVWFNTYTKKLFININTHQNPLNYINIPITNLSNATKQYLNSIIIILRKNNNINDTKLSPIRTQHNYVLEVYVNGVNYSKILSFSKPPDYTIINKGTPLINKGDIYINIGKKEGIQICNLTYYNHAIDTNKILEIVRNNNKLYNYQIYTDDLVDTKISPEIVEPSFLSV